MKEIKSKYAVQHFKANSPAELADAIQKYFDSVELLSTVSVSYRNASYFSVPTMNNINPQMAILSFEAILTVRVRQQGEDADVSL